MTEPNTTPNTTHPETLLHPDALRTLRLLFELANGDIPAHAGGIAARLALASDELAARLLELEAAGLARAETARLTMAGLVLATRLPSVSSPGRKRPEATPFVPGRRRRARNPGSLPPGFVSLRSLPKVGGKSPRGAA